MPAGDELAGEGLAGDEPVLRVPAAPAARQVAVSFDPNTRDFPLGEDGRYVEIHRVDSAVQLALFLEFGKVPSAQRTGNTLRAMAYVDPRRMKAEATSRVETALARLTRAGDVTIDDVDAESRRFGGMNVAVSYFNERLPGRPRRTITPTR